MSALSVLFVAVGVMLAPAAYATALQHVDTRTLTRGSHEIVIGKVERVESHWNAARTQIVTDVTLRVTRSIKGATRERLTLTQLGGEADGVRVSVHAVPVFKPGEEALVFVWRDAGGRAQVNGLAQGKFEIKIDPRTRRHVVQRGTPGFAIRDARTLAAVGAQETVPAIGVEELVAEIEREIRSGGVDRR